MGIVPDFLAITVRLGGGCLAQAQARKCMQTCKYAACHSREGFSRGVFSRGEAVADGGTDIPCPNTGESEPTGQVFWPEGSPSHR